MPELQRLRGDHAPAILEFEIANRAYFAASVGDRGDEYFAQFAEQHNLRLTEQDNGEGAYYVLVGEHGAVLGRFNLILVGDGVATLGYRVAELVAGHGVATAMVRDVCRLAASEHAVSTIRAAIADANPASRRVLLKSGFAPAGPADPVDIGGKVGTWYELTISSEPRERSRSLARRSPSQ
jgi:ribosomal-protein-alanine N-acetyltransferase